MSRFELRETYGYGSSTLIKTDTIEDVLRFAAEKSGEESVDELLEDL